MNRRQALTLSGLLTGTILTGGVAATGLLYATHSPAQPAAVRVVAAPTTTAPAPIHHEEYEGVD
ncbi:MAG: hypothetical protein U0Y82_10630 [Thermoleophilia bacterium]